MQGSQLRDIFSKLTVSSNQDGWTPLDAYVWYIDQIRTHKLNPTSYGSTAITSGGHRWVPGLDQMQIIESNTKSARLLVAELERNHQLTVDELVLPVDVGYIKHWRQSDYIYFWLMVIMQPDLHKSAATAEAFADRLGAQLHKTEVNLDIFNSETLTNTERASEYFKYAEAFIEILQRFEHSPLSRMLRLIDPDLSLGGQTERYAARMMEIPVFNVVAVEPSHNQINAIQSRTLRRDISPIIKYGGTVVSPATRRMIILEKTEA